MAEMTPSEAINDLAQIAYAFRMGQDQHSKTDLTDSTTQRRYARRMELALDAIREALKAPRLDWQPITSMVRETRASNRRVLVSLPGDPYCCCDPQFITEICERVGYPDGTRFAEIPAEGANNE
jgi:hypothetical protein